MLIKLPILMALIYYHTQSEDSLKCANIWVVLMLILALVQGASGFYVIVWLVVTYFVALGYFSLLEFLGDRIIAWWFSTLIGAILMLVL